MIHGDVDKKGAIGAFFIGRPILEISVRGHGNASKGLRLSLQLGQQ